MNWILMMAAAAALHAQTPRKLTFQSSHDTFDLILNSKTSGTVDGKPANLINLNELWPVLNSPIGNECPTLKGAPDVTVKEGASTRSIYLEQGMVSDGKFCLNVGGEGLLYFPLHREFLIGPKRDAIQLKSPLKLFRQGEKVLDLHKEGTQWVSETPEVLLNWDFIERFENSLRNFDVRLRVQPEIAKNKTKMIVQSGEQTYEFFKVTPVMWAVRKPGAKWLLASDDWSFWYNFEQDMFEDRHAPEIRTLQRAGVAHAERKAALDKLEGIWSRNLRDLYHKFLLDAQEDQEFKRVALNRLKRKPSLETSGVVIQFLNGSASEDLKRLAGQILKLHYPKGPLYKPNLPPAEKRAVVDFWNNWWKVNQKRN